MVPTPCPPQAEQWLCWVPQPWPTSAVQPCMSGNGAERPSLRGLSPQQSSHVEPLPAQGTRHGCVTALAGMWHSTVHDCHLLAPHRPRGVLPQSSSHRLALTSMEMESGSTPRSVLLSKGSKMSSRMLAGCRTYPHCPLDRNKAWFICMGLSGERRRKEVSGGDHGITECLELEGTSLIT